VFVFQNPLNRKTQLKDLKLMDGKDIGQVGD
jgi:hypothetical protein